MSPTMTPARLEANRRNGRNARKSTGPRTAQGKSQSRLNSLREGNRSALRRDAVLLGGGRGPCHSDTRPDLAPAVRGYRGNRSLGGEREGYSIEP
jgi:hypothetical protein